eukprot:TRINITY_DN18027_c0_g1::TRINITY_DN18027_c0_g1_i1::g.11485::m.11485 TRINITY_DN18027_c0_g1::TRINITY_DN18027_c0_g1_i1::g.11485  ORF type:complete len:193 (-),score=16.76,DUF87/PF01935.12/0.14 TRINITY_DN18027_c0_g1_i1:59-637(-)
MGCYTARNGEVSGPNMENQGDLLNSIQFIQRNAEHLKSTLSRINFERSSWDELFEPFRTIASISARSEKPDGMLQHYIPEIKETPGDPKHIPNLFGTRGLPEMEDESTALYAPYQQLEGDPHAQDMALQALKSRIDQFNTLLSNAHTDARMFAKDNLGRGRGAGVSPAPYPSAPVDDITYMLRMASDGTNIT